MRDDRFFGLHFSYVLPRRNAKILVFLKMRKINVLSAKNACHRFCHRDFLPLLTPFICRVGCKKMHSEILCSGYGGGIGAWYDGWGMVGWGGAGCNMSASIQV